MASSSSSTGQQEYVGFLSFRGEDTRRSFVSHLHAALERGGIKFFIDKNLNKGEKISPTLLRRIEESKISIIVLSENYASSSWCLEELSKILECKTTNGQKVVPIFYHVEPSDVRNQKGGFGEAFSGCQERFSDGTDKVKKWTDALVEVGNLCGWHLTKHIPEAKFIDEIVNSVWTNLYDEFSSDFEGLVGMESRIKELENLLNCMKSDGVRIIGIWGMPGVGKTTTAEVFFKHISSQFDASHFSANVRKKSMTQGLQCARNELLSKLLKRDVNIDTPSIKGTTATHLLRCRKVLIVLDDVSESEQVEELIEEPSYFGPGSTIIITSRDKEALNVIANKIYMIEKLTFDQARVLFCRHASRGGRDMSVKEEDPNLIGVVRYADGIPLALKILGDFLCGKSEGIWQDAVRRLNMKIHEVLRISYDELQSNERNIFLDVACFFEGEDRNYVTTILKGCGFNTEIGIKVLINKSLITILNNNLIKMNYLIQEMGKEIVRQESKDPGYRSRLWIYTDIDDILTTEQGTEKVQGIFLNTSEIEEPMYINPKAFLRMPNLRLLKIYNPQSEEDYKVLLQDHLDELPDNLHLHRHNLMHRYWHKLVYLHWQCCPLNSFQQEFCPRKLVELHMHYSHVIQLWERTPNLSRLKWIDFSYSKCLEKIPDLSKAPNLERINLVGCTSLLEIPIISARSLPKLQAVYLSGCSNLKKFPLLSSKVEELHLDGTAIEEVPSEIQRFSSLVKLNMKNCNRLKKLPRIHGELRLLEFLDLSGCSSLTDFPEISRNLKELLLNETAIEELPSSIECFGNLVSLKLKNCTRIAYLPSGISKLESLECLDLSGCSNITDLVKTPGNLKMLYLEGTGIAGEVQLQLPANISIFRGELSKKRRLNSMINTGNDKELYLEGTAMEEHALTNCVSQETRQC